MALRKSLINAHFGLSLDIMPDRENNWSVHDEWSMADRLWLLSVSDSNLVVSGDCMAAIGIRRKHRKLPLVWYDAHGDFHVLNTSKTCSIGGMPLAMLAGLGDQSLMDRCAVNPISGIYHVGMSAADRLEYARMVSNGIVVVDSILFQERLLNQDRVHLHIDTDVISSKEIAAAFHPSPDGMSITAFWQEMDIIMPKAEILSIKAFDPRKDHDGRGQELVKELIRKFELCYHRQEN